MSYRRAHLRGTQTHQQTPPLVWVGTLTVILLFLVSCTGSVQNYPPRLLIVGLIDDTTPEIALVEDTFMTTNAVPERLRFIEASRRTLAEPAVAFDVVDRSDDRSELVVLSRGDIDPYPSYLDFFNLAGIDSTTPVAFATTRSRIDLSALVGVENFCPTEIGIGQDGQLAAVFSDRTACTGDDFRAIYFLNLDTETVAGVIDGEPIMEAGMHINQALAKAYFLVDEISTSLYSVNLDGTNQTLVSDEFEITDPLDLGPAGGVFLVLQESEFQTIDLSVAPPVIDTPVNTHTDASILIESPGNLVPEVSFLSGDDLVVHADVLADLTETFTSTALNGVIEPMLGFAYLVEEGGLQIFDLVTFDTNPGQAIASFSVSQITSPGPISWTQGLLLQ